MSNSFTWSWSQLECFEECPRKWHHRHILKEKEPPSDALEKGKAVHAACENVMLGKQLIEAAYIPSPHLVDSVFRAARRPGIAMYVEHKMGLTSALTPCEFFGKNVSGRSALDITLVNEHKAWIGDWKTGQVREKDDQVMIEALFTFRHFPEVDYIVANNIWLEAGKVGKTYEFFREKENEYWAQIIPRLQRLEQAWREHISTPTPNRACNWCPIATCSHNKNRKIGV